MKIINIECLLVDLLLYIYQRHLCPHYKFAAWTMVFILFG